MSVTTVKRVDHTGTLVSRENARRAASGQSELTDTEIATMFGPDEATTHPERFMQTVDYTDGFGRLLQNRSQADDLVVDDIGVSVDLNATLRTATAHQTSPAAPAVVVSGWTVYDNKGHVAVSYEPFLGAGYHYSPPDDYQLAGLGRVVHHYDARGLAWRTVAADGSESMTVPGIPLDLHQPAVYVPTPWERYTYDPNDNAGRTNPTSTLEFVTHWNAPPDSLIDAFGRTVATVVRTNGDPLTTTQTYDIDGNLLATIDPLGRLAACTVYDLVGRPWRTWQLDRGVVHTVRDAAGALVEQRDDKGALILAAFDNAHRPTRAAGRPTDPARGSLFGL